MNDHTQNIMNVFDRFAGSLLGIIGRTDRGDPRYRKYWRLKLREVDREIKSAKEAWAKYVSVELPTAFRIETRKMQAYFLQRKYRRTTGRKWQPQTIRAIEDWIILRMFDGLDAGRRDIARLFHLRQLAELDRAKINESLAEQIRNGPGPGGGPLSDREAGEALRRGLIGPEGGNPKTIHSEILKTLEKRIAKEGKVILLQQNGKTIRYRPVSFAKKLARRGIATAQNRATLATILEFGEDLVRITDHNTDTEICLPFEGGVFSISGRHPDFPALTTLPPFHDFCLHGVAPFIEATPGTKRAKAQKESIDASRKRTRAKLEAIRARKAVIAK